MNFCTLFDYRYIAQGVALCDSLALNNPSCQIYVLAYCQRSYKVLSRLRLPCVTLVSLQQLETRAVQAMKSKLDAAEYAWSLKSALMLHILRSGAGHILYLDADCYALNRDSIVAEQLRGVPLALTPHRFAPAHKRFIQNGKFNAGFIYARSCATATACLTDWGDKCVHKRKGRMTDQLLLNDWPETYGAHIINHKGINLAPWNQEQYSYTIASGVFFVDDDPLVLYHFHQGLKPAYPVHPFLRIHLYSLYANALQRAKEKL